MNGSDIVCSQKEKNGLKKTEWTPTQESMPTEELAICNNESRPNKKKSSGRVKAICHSCLSKTPSHHPCDKVHGIFYEKWCHFAGELIVQKHNRITTTQQWHNNNTTTHNNNTNSTTMNFTYRLYCFISYHISHFIDLTKWLIVWSQTKLKLFCHTGHGSSTDPLNTIN